MTSSRWQVDGHHWAVDLLQRALIPPSLQQNTNSGPRHAYLLLGVSQIGKSTLARAFANALLCSNDSDRPCGKCRSCQLMQRGAHPDFRLIQPLDKDGAIDRYDGTLRVEQAATIIHEVALRPVEGRHKVFLIQDFHSANLAFANKLLKTLEEPPAPVILLLTATDRSALLPTIISRCQVLELRPLPTPTIEQVLVERYTVEPVQARTLARLSSGRLGWAIQQAQHKASGDDRRVQLETLWRLIRANRVERLAFAEQMATARNSRHLFELIELWTIWWRDIMLAQSGCRDDCSNIDQLSEIEQQASAVPIARVQAYLKTLRQIEEYLHHTINTRLALEVLFLRLPQLSPE